MIQVSVMVIHKLIAFGVIAESGAFVGESDGLWGNTIVDGCDAIVDGSNWQVVTLGFESVLIGFPAQSDLLAFGGDVVDGAFVGVAFAGLVGVLAVRILGVALQLLLGLRLFAGGVVRASIAMSKTRKFVDNFRFSSQIGIAVVQIGKWEST